MRRIVWSLLSLACSCTYLRHADVPMTAVFHAAPVQAPMTAAKGLVVLLPGLGDGPADFESNGIIAEIQRLDPTLDVIAADAHFGYYRAQTFLERLQTDILDPIAANYGRIWLVGISMGGLGSALYAERYPDAVEGLILLAPYMGDADAIAAVELAGGLASWTPPVASSLETDTERAYRELWTWYRGYATAAAATRPKLYLGYGTEDQLAAPNSLLGAILPAERRATMPGGHKWSVWRPLFAELAARAFSN